MESAIQLFIKVSLVHRKASKEGDYKVGDKAYDEIVKAVRYFRENNPLALVCNECNMFK